MRFKNHRGYIRNVILIEYLEGVPHLLLAARSKQAADTFDCFCEGGDKNDLRLYNSGGGPIDGSYGENYVSPEAWSIWVEKGYEFLVKNAKCRVIERPILLTNGSFSNINPFVVGTEAFDENWCDLCNHHTEELCDEHLYYDDDGDIRYRHNDEITGWY